MRANVLSCVVLLMCVLHTTQAATTSLRLVGQVVTGNKTATTEQVAFDDKEKIAYLVGGQQLYIVDLAPEKLFVNGILPTSARTLNVTQKVELANVVNDVVFCGHFLAISTEAVPKNNSGTVTIYNRYLRAGGANSLKKLADFQVGALPDQLTFSKDCKTILVSNEGEPVQYTPTLIDPEGSVSVINLEFCDNDYTRDEAEMASDEAELEADEPEEKVTGTIERKHHKKHYEERKKCVYTGVVTGTVRTADFRGFNDKKQALINAGVKITGPGSSVAQDLEPEFTTFSEDESIAFTSLQENNAVAVVDVKTATIRAIYPLGFKNHSNTRNPLDPTDVPLKVTIGTWPVFGMYMPDEMKSFRHKGCDYLVTANEGDARSYAGLTDEARVRQINSSISLSMPGWQASFAADEEMGKLNVLTANNRAPQPGFGADPNDSSKFIKLFSFGARSFAIWKYEEVKGQQDVYEFSLVYDSADELEQYSKNLLLDIYNSDGKNATFDTRSDNKGPEPEGLTIGPCSYKPRGYTIQHHHKHDDDYHPSERRCLFLGTERTSVIFVYDITDPTSPFFQSVARPPQTNSTNVATRLTAPEGMTYERYTAGSQSFSMVLAAFEAQADADLAGMGIYQVVRS